MVQESKVGNLPKVSRGKFCIFDKNELYRHGLSEYYYKPIDKIDLEELKNKIKSILLLEKFVFFDEEDIVYKYKTKGNKLIEFSINFRHIQ